MTASELLFTLMIHVQIFRKQKFIAIMNLSWPRSGGAMFSKNHMVDQLKFGQSDGLLCLYGQN
jgi:hypothetical protein